MNQPCQEKEWGNKAYYCFFDLTLQVIGGKWKLMVIFHLAEQGTLRFGELRRTLPGITERMLVKQLRELEADGIVARKVHNTVPPCVEYSLTSTGLSLIPTIHTMRAWGENYEKNYSGKVFPVEDGFESPHDLGE